MGTTHKMVGETLELSLVGTIGDGWSDDPITAKAVRKALKEAPKASLIRAYIDSFGGSYHEGIAIYQMLSAHQARVEIEVGACAASAASIIAMAGDEISMHETSTMLIHEVWTISIGRAADLRKDADALELLSKQAARAYSARTAMPEEEVLSLMAEDRYMAADECKKLGFCTTIRKAKTKGKASFASPTALTEAFVRAQVKDLRSEAEQRLSEGRLAAMAPPEPATQPPEGKEQPKMDPNLILAALGLPEGATTEQIAEFASNAKRATEQNAKLLGAVEASTVDEAIGKIAALDAASKRLTAAEAELATMRADAEKAERESIVKSLRAEGKITPAQEASLLPALSNEALRAFAATAPATLKGDGVREPKSNATPSNKSTAASDAPRWNGKTYAELSNVERLSLADEDAELFTAMRSHALDNRLI